MSLQCQVPVHCLRRQVRRVIAYMHMCLASAGVGRGICFIIKFMTRHGLYLCQEARIVCLSASAWTVGAKSTEHHTYGRAVVLSSGPQQWSSPI